MDSRTDALPPAGGGCSESEARLWDGVPASALPRAGTGSFSDRTRCFLLRVGPSFGSARVAFSLKSLFLLLLTMVPSDSAVGSAESRRPRRSSVWELWTFHPSERL